MASAGGNLESAPDSDDDQATAPIRLRSFDQDMDTTETSLDDGFNLSVNLDDGSGQDNKDDDIIDDTLELEEDNWDEAFGEKEREGRYKRSQRRSLQQPSSTIEKKKDDITSKIKELTRNKLNSTQRESRKNLYELARNPTTGRRVTHCEYREKCKTTNAGIIDDAEDVEVGIDLPPESLIQQEKEDLNSAIQSCLDFIKKDLNTKVKRQQSWMERMQNYEDSWAGSREEIMKIVLAANILSDKCQHCFKLDARIHCKSCLVKKDVCLQCDKIIHEINPFHNRRAWMNGSFVDLAPTQCPTEDNDIVLVAKAVPLLMSPCSCCGSTNLVQHLKEDTCCIINSQGRFDLNIYTITCLDCSQTHDPFNLKTVIRSRYWPASVNSFTYLFDQDLFILWDCFKTRMPGSSEHNFLNALEEIAKMNARIPTINKQYFTTAYREWKYCQFELETLMGKSWFLCPVCTISQHSCHVDGNCKLYRYKSAGSQRNQGYYDGIFIAPNEEVDKLVTEIYKKPQNQEYAEGNSCGGTFWKAALNVGRKKGSLHETGLEIASCRHCIGQKAVNMFQGEIFGYALYIHKSFIAPNEVKFMWSDVICRYWPWVKKNAPELAEKVLPALSVMHAKGHGSYCQVVWDGEWQTGAARTTGEEVEQVNSYLSRLGSTTKHMLPENREDSLTEHMMSWNKRKIENIAGDLCKRYLRMERLLEATKQSLEAKINEFGIADQSQSIANWITELKMHAQVVKDAESGQQLNEKEELIFLYSVLLEQNALPLTDLQKYAGLAIPSTFGLKFLKTPVRLDLQKTRLVKLVNKYGDTVPSLMDARHSLLEISIKQQQKLIEQSCFKMAHNTYMVNKLAETSKRRHALRKMVTKEKEHFQCLCQAYRQIIEGQPLHKKCPSSMEQLCKEGKFPWNNDSKDDKVTLEMKRQLSQLYVRKVRIIEEMNLLPIEMQRLLHFFTANRIQSLESSREYLEKILRKDDDIASICPRPPMYDDCQTKSTVERYSTQSSDPLVVAGKISVINEGIRYFVKNIENAISRFKSTLKDEIRVQLPLHLADAPDDNLDYAEVLFDEKDGSFTSDDSSDSETDEDDDIITAELLEDDFPDILF